MLILVLTLVATVCLLTFDVAEWTLHSYFLFFWVQERGLPHPTADVPFGNYLPRPKNFTLDVSDGNWIPCSQNPLLCRVSTGGAYECSLLQPRSSTILPIYLSTDQHVLAPPWLIHPFTDPLDLVWSSSSRSCKPDSVSCRFPSSNHVSNPPDAIPQTEVVLGRFPIPCLQHPALAYTFYEFKKLVPMQSIWPPEPCCHCLPGDRERDRDRERCSVASLNCLPISAPGFPYGTTPNATTRINVLRINTKSTVFCWFQQLWENNVKIESSCHWNQHSEHLYAYFNKTR